ncbi:hypothetical protein SAMN05216516_1048 [Izhakiella capsodis]|uniref:Uncharacterized protein n=1 Tax=Izhakiella capsodis TaxID=1367852 RepID=A0A1I4XBH2_9GAMM|nr:hypothetical protein [Izhakiella capsodis]SFN22843.1 hypothetical protein SAMN05216516_1048 [Izhakiella capsodis]
MIIFNKEFSTKIANNLTSSFSLPNKLLCLIDEGFVIHSNECIFFRSTQPIDTNENDGNFFDKTEQECFYNELRISDYIKKDIASIAVNFAEGIIGKLKKMESKKFEVIVIFDDFDGELDAVIKLHTLRNEETPYIDIKSIDEYQQPIFICRTE